MRAGAAAGIVGALAPRLDDLIARNLAGSKTAARRLLAAGAVTDPAGNVLSDPRQPVAPGEPPATVLVDGRALALHDSVYLLLHKPAGYLTALRDAQHPVAATLVAQAPLAGELRPVGRLDLDTTGLLLWTNDGPWLQRLTHPKRAVPRTYQAALARPHDPLPADLVLDDGHRPAITELGPLPPEQRHAALVIPAGATAFVRITVTGGAYHEVRRIFAALGSHVLSLCRTHFGPFALPPALPPGQWQLLPAADAAQAGRATVGG
jgi:16S rRNA pseudouridine516 synthase